MTPRLLTEHHLEFLCFKGDRTGSSESTFVKIPHCWKSHVTAQLISNWPSYVFKVSCIGPQLKNADRGPVLGTLPYVK